MAVSCQVVRFQKDSSGTEDVTQDVSLNFTPKAIILLSDGSTTDDTFTDHSQLIQGFSDGTNHACITIVGRDVSTVGETAGIHRNDSVFVRLQETATTTELSRATCAFATNKVTFTWTLNDTDATYITLIAFGGTDITNAKVNTVQVNTDATGTVDYTGLGFTVTGPNGILFTMAGSETTANSATGAGSSSFGAAVSSTQRYCISNTLENTGGTTDAWRYGTAVECLVSMLQTTGAIDYFADFDSWISGGFRLDYENAPASTTLLFSYLVIKGGTWDCGTETTLTANGDETTTVVASSNTIRGMGTGITGLNFVANTTTSAHGYRGMGFSDGTNEGWVDIGYRDANATSQTVRRNSATNRILGVNGAAAYTANTTPMYIDADFSSFGTNQFTLSYVTVHTATVDFGWWIVADSAAGPQIKYGDITETSISVSETLARLQVIGKAISDTPTISVSETLEKVATLPRSITNEPEVSVSAETLERIQYLIKLITNEPNVTIPAETLAKVAAYPRPIVDTPTVSVSESLERIQSFLRAISDTPTIDISELLAKSALFPKTISDTPTVSISETLERIQYVIKQITTEPEISISELIAGNFLISRLINESPSISVSETLERIQYLIKTISDTPEVAISELLTGLIPVIIRSISEPSVTTDPTTVERLATFLRSITVAEEPLIDVSDTLASILSYLRNITNEPEITTNDVASILSLLIRTLAEPSQNISEDLTRIQSIIKEIADPEISTNDTVTGLRTLLVTILESRIKWYYSLLTRKIPEDEV